MTEPLFKVGMQVVELDIYGFPIKVKGRLRIRTIIEDSLRTASILKTHDVHDKFSTLDYISIAICTTNYKMFIPLNEYHNLTKKL